MKRKINAVLMVLIFAISMFFAAACSNNSTGSSNNETNKQTQTSKIKVATLKGPTGMGMVKLMEENKSDYDISLYDSPDQIVSKIVSGEIDAAAIPSNLAAVLYNKTKGKIELAGINTLGVLYVVENGNSIKSIKDLKGKTVYMSGKGSVPEFAFDYILEKNGLNPDKDLKIEYKSDHSEVASDIASKKVDVAVLPEPFVTTTKVKDKEMNVSLDLTKEWDKISGGKSRLIMGTLVFRKEFIDRRQKDADKFIERYSQSVNFVNKSPAEASKLIEKNGIVPKAKIAEMSIPRCNIVFINAKDGRKSLENFYSVLNKYNPKSIGGKIPNENFYYSGNKTN